MLMTWSFLFLHLAMPFLHLTHPLPSPPPYFSSPNSRRLSPCSFELFDLDPFWVPRTEEELEDLGEKGERENVAKKYMDGVRRRKGMHVDQRMVEAAEKQRNLKSN